MKELFAITDAMIDQAEANMPRAERFNPDALAYEAFKVGEHNTYLLDPLNAGSLNDALAETTSRWAWGRGDRLAIREIGGEVDRLHVYACRQKAHGIRPTILSNLEYARWLDHVCTIDLNVVAGLPVGLVSGEHQLHERRQRQRPEGARR